MKSDKLSVFEFVNSVFDRTCHDPCPREPLRAIKFWQVTVLAEIVLGSRNPLSHLLASSSKTFRMVAPMRTFAPLNVTVESHGMVSGRVGPTKTFKSGTNPPFRASPNLFFALGISLTVEISTGKRLHKLWTNNRMTPNVTSMEICLSLANGSVITLGNHLPIMHNSEPINSSKVPKGI